MARARGANAVLALAFNTGAYGAVPVSGFHKLPFVTSDLGDEQNLIESDLLGLGRSPGAPSLDVVNNEGNVVVPVDLRNFGQWLKLLLGAPTTTGADEEFVHTFEAGGLTLPDAAIEVGNPDVPSYGMNYGVMGNSLSISLARSGHLNATVGLIAQGEDPATSSAAGTPAEAVVTRFSQFSGEILGDDVALGDVVSGTVNFSNNLDKVEVIRPDGRITGADPGQGSGTGDVVLRFKDRVLMDKAVAGTPIKLAFRWTIATGKTLTLTVPRVFLPKPKVPIAGPGGIQATFAYQADKDPVSGKWFTAVLANDVETY